MRPSEREKRKKVSDALQSIRSGHHQFGPAKHQSMSWDFLEVVNTQEFWGAIEQLLEELLNNDPHTCYAGSYPPQKSYESPPLKNEELWAYSWTSSLLGKNIYLKFILKRRPPSSIDPQSPFQFIFVDCHESNPH